MKKYLKIAAAALSSVMLMCNPVLAADAAVQIQQAENGTMYFNFTADKVGGATNVRFTEGIVPKYNSEKGYGFVSQSINLPPREVDINKIKATEKGFQVTENDQRRFNIVDKNGDALDLSKSTCHNFGGMIFRVKAPAGGYHIQVETEDGSQNAIVSVSAMQPTRIETTENWDAAKLVKNQHLAEWQDNVWTFDYANGHDFIDIEVEPRQAGKPVILKSIKITPVENSKGDECTLFVLGDSTLKSYCFDEAPMCGWGQVFDRLFDSSRIKVVNYSMGGRSLKQMYQEGRLNDILMTAKEGDYIVFQSAHNDEKDTHDIGTAADPQARFGVGATEDMYREFLTDFYLPAIKARGVRPVMVTAMTRVKDTDDESYVFENSFTTENRRFIDVMREVAQQEDIPLADLNAKSVEYLNSIGVAAAQAMVMSLEAGETPGKTNSGSYANGHPQNKVDGTHMKEALAKQYARIVAEEIHRLAKDYEELEALDFSLSDDVKAAIESDDWSQVYPEVAKDCMTGENAYYRNQIEKMLQLGVMSKDEEGNFNPNGIMTVGEYKSALCTLWDIDKEALKAYKDSASLTREVMAAMLYDAYGMKFSQKPAYMTDYNGTNITPDSPNYDPNLVGEEASYYPLVGYGLITDKWRITPRYKNKVEAAYNLGLIRAESGIERGKMVDGNQLEPLQEVTRAKAAKSLYFMYVLGSSITAENDVIVLDNENNAAAEE